MELDYFKFSEFDSGLGDPDFHEPNSGEAFMDRDFLKALDRARYLSGFPWKVNSGYRSQRYNDYIGGAKDSAHTLGLAADIRYKTAEQAFRIIHAAIEVGMHGIILYDGFVHMDMGSKSDILKSRRPFFDINLK